MKLENSGQRTKRIKSRELLFPETATPEGFDIHADVTEENWKIIGKDLKKKIQDGHLYEIDHDIAQLVLLGPENDTGLDMPQVIRIAIGEGFRHLDVLLPIVFESGSWVALAKNIINLAILAPKEIQSLKDMLPEDVTKWLWEEFEKRLKPNFLGACTFALALFLLFPEQRDLIREKLVSNQPKIKFENWHNLASHEVLAFAILFPGTFPPHLMKDKIPGEKLGVHNSKKYFPLNSLTNLHLLSAEDIQVKPDGKIQVIPRRPAMIHSQPIPERDVT